MEEYSDIQAMSVRPPRDCSQDECTKTAFQCAEVSVPIEIRPEAKLGDVELECCGEPTVICRESEHHDHEKCEITIIQKLCIKIPITYKVRVCKEEEMISCDMHDMCCG